MAWSCCSSGAPSVYQLKLTTEAIVVDLNGTLHGEQQLLHGSLEAVKRLRQTETRYKFVSNTSRYSKRMLLERLGVMGLIVGRHEVYTSLTTSAKYVQVNGLRPMLLVADEAVEDFRGVDTNNPNAVVVALAPQQLNYNRMNAAFRLLQAKPEVPLLAVHKGRYLKTDSGLSLGPGPFIAALEYASGKPATVIGKPSEKFFQTVLKDMGLRPGAVLMIGDDVHDDIIGALKVGMAACLVRTGKYRPGDEDTLFEDSAGRTHIVRDHALVMDCFADMIFHLLGIKEEPNNPRQVRMVSVTEPFDPLFPLHTPCPTNLPYPVNPQGPVNLQVPMNAQGPVNPQVPMNAQGPVNPHLLVKVEEPLIKEEPLCKEEPFYEDEPFYEELRLNEQGEQEEPLNLYLY